MAELNEMKRRLTALERKPQFGSVFERLPVGSFQSDYLEGVADANVFHILGAVNTTGANMPVVFAVVPFFIPTLDGTNPLDVAATFSLYDPITGTRSVEFQVTKSHFTGTTQELAFVWRHPQPIGFEDDHAWRAIRVDYRLNKVVIQSGTRYTVAAGPPTLAVGLPLNTFVEESAAGAIGVGTDWLHRT
ncbi:hypothetical protein [Streptomyces sp. x-80]|uniref:hypothetical protein n=1 Tax=Streptomyces sp. x-80 TaxID=2789282 RepID=UPI00397F860D